MLSRIVTNAGIATPNRQMPCLALLVSIVIAKGFDRFSRSCFRSPTKTNHATTFARHDASLSGLPRTTSERTLENTRNSNLDEKMNSPVNHCGPGGQQPSLFFCTAADCDASFTINASATLTNLPLQPSKAYRQKPHRRTQGY